MNNIFNVKSYFRFLGKNLMYTLIEIFGLSVSLMFVIIIATYVTQEISTDSFQENADRVYAVGSEGNIGSAYRIADRIEERYPEIEKTCPMVTSFKKLPISLSSEKKMNADMLFTKETFFDLFSFQLTNGDRNSVLAAKNNAVISESFANRAFPDKDPIGQVITLNDSVSVIVNGIMKDIKNSTIPYADIVIRIDNVKYFNSGMDSQTFDNAGSAIVFIMTKPGTDIKAKADDMLAYFKEIFWIYKRELRTEVAFIPLKEIYFSDLDGGGGWLVDQGNWKFVIILISVGILILIFAIINYINLTVAQTGFRAKEMATRRLLGSSRGELFTRLMFESTLLCFISAGIGIVMAYSFVPFANDLLQTKIFISDMITPLSITIALTMILAIGVISGLLPATVISRVKPVEAVKGAFRAKTKMVYSKFFITFQNAITIALVAASLTMVLQINHMIEAPLGYNTKNLIEIEVDDLNDRNLIFTVGSEMEKLASVSRIAYSEGTPFTRGNNHNTMYNGRNISFQVLGGDSTFFEIFGFEIIRDNKVTDKTKFYVTQRACLEMEIPEDTTGFSLFGQNFTIAGVIRDFQLANINQGPTPTLLQMKRTEDIYPWNITVEVVGEPFAAFDAVKKTFERVTELEFKGEFTDKRLADSFSHQRRTAKILTIFTSIAVILSLLGLLAMSTYYIQQRSREIAVRKVFGSTNAQVLRKLVSKFLNYVLIAFVVITPIIWYIMNDWLSDFSYKISLNPLIFITAGLFCLIISFITVFWQSYKAANDNPIKRIKTE